MSAFDSNHLGTFTLTMASVMNTFFIDKIDNIRVEFPLLEENLPSYSFLSMDANGAQLVYIILNKPTCSSDPFPIILLMSHQHATSLDREM